MGGKAAARFRIGVEAHREPNSRCCYQVMAVGAATVERPVVALEAEHW
jgi:hypothetical protein